MGKQQSRDKLPESQIISQPPPLTPLERWNLSEHSVQDLNALLQTSSAWSECAPSINLFLKTVVTSQEKYQHCMTLLLDYLKQDKHRCSEVERKQLFTHYFQKLGSSFFVKGDFHENNLNINLQPRQKLHFLYEYCSFSQQVIFKAVFFNFPSVLSQFQDFITELIQTQIIIKKLPNLLTLVLKKQKIQLMQQQFEKISPFLTRLQYERAMEQLSLVYGLKSVYWRAAKQFMRYDNAEMTVIMIEDMLSKRYALDETEYEYYLKVELFSLFLYDLGKLNLSFQQFQRKRIVDIIHLFYSYRSLQDTPLLAHCFDLYPNSPQQWHHHILNYCFSTDSHISMLVHLVQHNYVQLQDTLTYFSAMQAKILHCKCDIGRYSKSLISLCQKFTLPPEVRSKFTTLLELIQCLDIFKSRMAVDEFYGLVMSDLSQADQETLKIYQQTTLTILQQLISSFLKHQQISAKNVKVKDKVYAFKDLYDLLQFLDDSQGYFFQNIISKTSLDQLLFKELIEQCYYNQIEKLLSKQNRQKYKIEVEPIFLLLAQHLVNLIHQNLSKKRLEIEKVLKILGVKTDGGRDHYLLSEYRYYQYLQNQRIHIPPSMSAKPQLQHFYHILEHYSAIESIDFDYLYHHLSCIQQQFNQEDASFSEVMTDNYLEFKVFLCHKLYAQKKLKKAQKIIDEVIIFEPPWLSADLVKIVKDNPSVDQNVINLAFLHCIRGQDLQYILNLESKAEKNESQAALSFRNLKKLQQLMKQQRYVCLHSDLILNQQEYGNLATELTYGKDQSSKLDYTLFFKLLSTDPQRSFNYALNYCGSPLFIVACLQQGIKRRVFHLTNLIPYLIRFLYFKLQKQTRNHQYIKYKEYKALDFGHILESSGKQLEIPSVSSDIANTLTKMIRNHEISQIINHSFLSHYVEESDYYKFMYEDGERKRIALELRQQPMVKNDAGMLNLICRKMGIDLVELTLYELIAKVNLKQEIDNQVWNIVQKLVYWTEQRSTALAVLTKISQKLQNLELLVRILTFLRQSGKLYKTIVTEDHLEIIITLANIEQTNNLCGMIPPDFYDREIGVYPSTQKGMLSEAHRCLLERSATIGNIFVLSKVLYFMYGCDEEIEKVVLGQFSLRQEDSEEFEALRKKIKTDSV